MASIRTELFQLSPEGVERVESLKKPSVRRQYFATIVMDLLSFSYGATCGWTSSSIPILKSYDDTPLESGPISTNDASWIASGICLGGFVGNLLIGWVKITTNYLTSLSYLKNFSAINENRPKGFAGHRRRSSNPWLGSDLLRNESVLLNNVSCSQWIFWWWFVLNHSVLHFWVFGWPSPRHFRINGRLRL